MSERIRLLRALDALNDELRSPDPDYLAVAGLFKVLGKEVIAEVDKKEAESLYAIQIAREKRIKAL